MTEDNTEDVRLQHQLPASIQRTSSVDGRRDLPHSIAHLPLRVWSVEPAARPRRLPRGRRAASHAAPASPHRAAMVAVLRRHRQHVHGLPSRRHPQQCRRDARVLRQPE